MGGARCRVVPSLSCILRDLFATSNLRAEPGRLFEDKAVSGTLEAKALLSWGTLRRRAKGPQSLALICGGSFGRLQNPTGQSSAPGEYVTNLVKHVACPTRTLWIQRGICCQLLDSLCQCVVGPLPPRDQQPSLLRQYW